MPDASATEQCQTRPAAPPYPADPMPAEIAALRDGPEPVWLFAYGSLMWNPDFPHAEARPALLRGYRRAFCLYSYDYRGTPERPGLVLGLDRGGACHGIAYRLAAPALAAAIDIVWAREMAGGVYRMRQVSLWLGGERVRGYAFVVSRGHPDYAAGLPLDAQARLIFAAEGSRGRCRDYLDSTLAHLDALGLADRPLRRLAERVRELGASAEAFVTVPGGR